MRLRAAASLVAGAPATTTFSAFFRGWTILEPGRWPAGSGSIILTFDDGPNRGVSEALLDVLEKHKVPAAFSLIGERVLAFPQIARRIHDQGHVIINHTYLHQRPLFSPSALDLEIRRTDQAIASALSCPDYRTTRFRPPYGLITPAIHFSSEARIRERAYLTFYVDDAAAQPSNANRIMRNIKRELTRFHGGAVVFHESLHTSPGSLASDKSWLPSAIEELIMWAHSRQMTFTKYR